MGASPIRRTISSVDDIIHSHLLHRSLAKLLIVASGNIGNKMMARLPVSLLSERIKRVDSHLLRILNQKALTVCC